MTEVAAAPKDSYPGAVGTDRRSWRASGACRTRVGPDSRTQLRGLGRLSPSLWSTRPSGVELLRESGTRAGICSSPQLPPYCSSFPCGDPSSPCVHTGGPAALRGARVAMPGGHRRRRPAGPAADKLRDAGQSIHASPGQPGGPSRPAGVIRLTAARRHVTLTSLRWQPAADSIMPARRWRSGQRRETASILSAGIRR